MILLSRSHEQSILEDFVESNQADFWTLISAAGVQKSKHIKGLSNVITLDELF